MKQEIELYIVKVGDCYLSSPGITTQKNFATKYTLKKAQQKREIYIKNGYNVVIIPVMV